MGAWSKYPVVFEVNTWVWLDSLRREYGNGVTLGNVPERALQELADYHFDAIWLMGVWQRSQRSREIAWKHPGLRDEYRKGLPDCQEKDVVGSPYAIYDYHVDRSLGTDRDLAELRTRLRSHGIRLLLDFVPGHLASDHPWLDTCPERLMQNDSIVPCTPGNYFRYRSGQDERWFAHGRDPNFGSWTDTVQLDYRRPETRRAMAEQVARLAECCDGLRCDMAMLVSRDVFLRIWGGVFEPPDAEFWPAAIAQAKAAHPDLLMVAEVYWDLEFELQQQGFDYTYDKRLYERLAGDDATGVRDHLRGTAVDCQSHLARFVENHDERRAADLFGPRRSRAAATIALALPGLRLLHQGQIEGCSLKVPVQLGRCLAEPPNLSMKEFYDRLLTALRHPVFHEGSWELLVPLAASDDNPSHRNFVAFQWKLQDEYRLVVVNLAGGASQCFLPLANPALAGEQWVLDDLLNPAVLYTRQGSELVGRGLYLDMPGYGYHLFQLQQHREAISVPPGTEDQDKEKSAMGKGGIPTGLRARSTLRGHRGGIFGLAWSPEGRKIATVGEDGSLRVWDSEHGTCTGKWYGHDDKICCVAWSPDGRMLATGSDDRTVCLWDAARGCLLRRMTGHYDHVLCVAWSPCGRMVASASTDRLVHVWDVEGGKVLRTLREHFDAGNCVAWSPDGATLASGSGDQRILLWDVKTWRIRRELRGRDWVSSMVWTPDGKLLASATGGGAVNFWDTEDGRLVASSEWHTRRVIGVGVSPDGRLFASKSADGTVRFWRRDHWEQLATLEEYGEYLGGVAFHPREPLLATREDHEHVIRIWDLDIEALIEAGSATPVVRHLNAKVALLGDTGVGKSGLGIRLAESAFRATCSTHGAQFWQIPVEPRYVCLPSEGKTRAEITLCDFAGQREFRLTNQLFLDDVDVALLLFDGSDPADPFRGVAFWAKVLRKQAPRHALKYLVAARSDVSPVTEGDKEIDRRLGEWKIDKYFRTSAKSGDGVDAMKDSMLRDIPWNKLPCITQPRLFQIIRDFLLECRQSRDVLVATNGVQSEASRRYARGPISQDELDRAVGLLQAQGLVHRIEPRPGLSFVLLRPELINVYASSIIHTAREHPLGIGAIPERQVLNGNLKFADFERPIPWEENLILESTVKLLIQHDLCFREMGNLVFPSQINLSRPARKTSHPPTEVVYRFSGSVEAIYASLVVRLSYTEYFQLEDRWRYVCEFSRHGERLGFEMRHVEEGTGELGVYLYPKVCDFDRVAFIRFITDHLRAMGVDIEQWFHLSCPQCGKEVTNDDAIRSRVHQQKLDIPCQYCGGPVIIPRSIEELYQDPSSRQKQVQLEKTVERRAESEIQRFQEDQQEQQDLHVEEPDHCVYILHISDLHMETASQARTWRTQLAADLRRELELKRLHYLVISGDVANHSTPEEYRAAVEMVNDLVPRFGLDSSRIVLVPGNHDVNWDLSKKAYRFVYADEVAENVRQEDPRPYIPAGDTGLLLREDSWYRRRFTHFSEEFYEKVILGKEFPGNYAEQAILQPFPEDRLLFLALNSSWNLDHHYSGRAGIHPEALDSALERMIDDTYDGWLKIAVWHHPVTGPEAMNADFLERLEVHGFEICLHGHIHEAIEGYHKYDDVRGISIVGAGTFGAPAKEQVTGIPLQYNLLVFDPKAGTLNVVTRKKEKPDGAWESDARWGSKKDPKPSYAISLRQYRPARGDVSRVLT